jgi:hypothetical protein
MKLKKFKEHKIKVGESEEDKLSKMKSSWQEYEDDQPWEFDLFWSKMEKYYNDYQHHYRDNSSSYTEYELNLYEYGPRDERSKKSVIFNDKEWQKRNGRISISVRTGGASGGSCWDTGDDPGAEPYDTRETAEFSKLKPYIEHILFYILGHNHLLYDIKQLVDEIPYNIIHEDTYTNYEYYGNYDDYSFMWVTLWDLYKYMNDKRAL